MASPQYRREGLPTTSRLVESLVGEVSARVKSTQKHRIRSAGAESILQLRAAVFSQDDRLPQVLRPTAGVPVPQTRHTQPRLDDTPVQTAA
ncbi:hypothetical protein R5W23_005539 [Gemmata sp. JC673]|uniref:Uncharacterized protein n=2 Tax=Gemmata algarum TaxID=2975278 RepID=A0ABU5ETX8_9BACT|nr:hypothetical protein [Gemmata algarum]